MAQLLRKKGTDEVYVYTTLLFERGDMEIVADTPTAAAVEDLAKDLSAGVSDELEVLLAEPKKRK